MKSCRIILLSFIIFFNIAFLQGQTNNAKSEYISFDVDYASFKAEEGKLLLEVYFLVSRSEFKFNKEEEKFASRHTIEIEIFRNDTLIVEDAWERIDRTEDVESVSSSQLLPDFSAFVLPAGIYNMRVVMTDVNTKISGVKQERIVLQSYQSDELVLSDVEFATSIKSVESNGIFTKYGRDIIPNAASTYGNELPVLYLYCEIYNLKSEEEFKDTEYQVEYMVTDLNGEEIIKLPAKVIKKPGQSSIDMGGINVVSLRSKGYIFRIRVTDLATNEVATRSKKFFIYRPGEVQVLAEGNPSDAFIGDGSYLESIYAEMTLKELDDEWEKLKILANKNERNLYKGSEKAARRKVILNYWKVREGRVSRDDYLERAALAKRQWSGMRDGWKTDRGRVILTYGKPDEIDRNPHSVDSRPFEIWRYFNIEGGIEFVFVDKQGFSDYELVHSSARNELQDYNWQRWIQFSATQSSQIGTIGR